MSTLHRISGCGSETRKADVIFIHGLGGDAFGTWRHGDDNDNSWPNWLGREFVDEVDVWSLGYAADPSKWLRVLGWFSRRKRDAGHSMPLPTRAGQVLDSMVQNDIGHRPILFICHSLGGLLVKQILRKANDSVKSLTMQKVAQQTRAVMFLATPHAGADLASRLDDLLAIFGATASIEDLRAHSAHLSDLYDWYCDHAPLLGIETKTYYEMRPIGGLQTIVNSSSARSGVGANPIALDEDHLSIAKPRDKDAQVCRAARELLVGHVLTDSRARPAPPAATPSLAMPTKNMSERPILSREANILLKKAFDGGGSILCVDAANGFFVQVGGANFVENGNPRSVAIWRSTINEIVRSGFVHGGGKGLYQLNREGYDYAEQLTI